MTGWADNRVVAHVTRGELDGLHQQVTGALRLMTRCAFIQRHVARMRWQRPRRVPIRRPPPEPCLPDDYVVVEFSLELWVAAILIFGLAESLTSALAFGASAGTVWAFAVLKTVLMVTLFFLSYYYIWKHAWVVPVLLCFVGTCLTINNLIVLL